MKKLFLTLIIGLIVFSGCGTTNEVVIEPEEPTEPGVVYLGLMVHLEGWMDEMDNEIKFDRHSGSARELATIFEEHGAKVTFEASPEFIEGCVAWESDILQELHDAGHGVGVHADAGVSSEKDGNSLEKFTEILTIMKEALEELVDFEVQHVSGTCSSLDWAKASIDAGYVFTTGGVGYCAMSMPGDLRPEEYKFCKSPEVCHGKMPLEKADRLHPWRVSTATGDWTIDDPDGELVIMSSDGGIKNIDGVMEYNDEDIDILVEIVEDAISLADPSKVNQLYFSLSIGDANVDEDFYTKMFEALQPYVDAGQIEYKSINEMYEEYVSDL